MNQKRYGLSIDTLKYIAIMAMLTEHIAFAFMEEETLLFRLIEMIGYTTGPIMFFAAVEGYHHTRNFKKYLWRLFLFACLSYLPFMYAWHDHFNPLRLNVLFTILLGLLAVHTRRRIKNVFLKLLLIFLLFILSLPADWGTGCIMIILIFDYYYGNLKNQLFGYLIYISTHFGVLSFFTHPFFARIYEGEWDFSYLESSFSSLGTLFPFFLLLFYNGKKGSHPKISKWLFYIFYPAHLAILALIRMYFLS